MHIYLYNLTIFWTDFDIYYLRKHRLKAWTVHWLQLKNMVYSYQMRSIRATNHSGLLGSFALCYIVSVLPSSPLDFPSNKSLRSALSIPIIVLKLLLIKPVFLLQTAIYNPIEGSVCLPSGWYSTKCNRDCISPESAFGRLTCFKANLFNFTDLFDNILKRKRIKQIYLFLLYTIQRLFHVPHCVTAQ